MDKVNPNHYKDYPKEAWEIMEFIWGREKFIAHCEMCAFKYRFRAGKKSGESIETDLAKAAWYEAKAKELRAKLDFEPGGPLSEPVITTFTRKQIQDLKQDIPNLTRSNNSQYQSDPVARSPVLDNASVLNSEDPICFEYHGVKVKATVWQIHANSVICKLASPYKLPNMLFPDQLTEYEKGYLYEFQLSSMGNINPGQ